MKRLGDLLNRVLVVGLVLVAAAVFLAARSAVNSVAEYKTMTAPKSLHQLSLEARPDATEGRGRVMLFGAGLGALVLLYAGVVAFVLPAGREFGRGMSRRRRPRRRDTAQPGNTAAPAPGLRVLPPVPRAPALPSMTVEEGRYEDIR